MYIVNDAIIMMTIKHKEQDTEQCLQLEVEEELLVGSLNVPTDILTHIHTCLCRSVHIHVDATKHVPLHSACLTTPLNYC